MQIGQGWDSDSHQDKPNQFNVNWYAHIVIRAYELCLGFQHVTCFYFCVEIAVDVMSVRHLMDYDIEVIYTGMQNSRGPKCLSSRERKSQESWWPSYWMLEEWKTFIEKYFWERIWDWGGVKPFSQRANQRQLRNALLVWTSFSAIFGELEAWKCPILMFWYI